MKLPLPDFKHLTGDSRSGFRLRRIVYYGVSLLGMRVVTLLVSIVSLPLTLNHLGIERYGLMEIVVTMVTLMSFSDLGLGFGLQNRLPEMEKNKDSNAIKDAISTVFYILIVVTIFISVAFYLVYIYVDWGELFKLESVLAQAEAAPTVLVFFLCFIIQVPLSVVNKLQVGYQEGHINSMWRAGGNIFGLAALLLVVNIGYGVPMIVLAIYGSQALFQLLNFGNQFLFRRKHLLPRVKNCKLSIFKYLYSDGVVFFVLQFSTIVLLSSDRIIIAGKLGIEEVAIFSVGYRLMTIFTSPLEAFINPLLPAFNDAIASGEYNWVKKVFIKVMKTVILLSSIFGVGVIIFGNPILDIWIGDSVNLSLSFLYVISFYIVYANLNSAISYIMLTPIFINAFIKYYIFAVAASLMLKYFLAAHIGVPGVMLGTMVGMSLFFFLPSISILNKSNFLKQC